MKTRMIMSKRLRGLLLLCMSLLLLSLAGCGQSEAAKSVDAMIAAIGEVTVDSKTAIEEAEKAVDALEQKDKDSLKNLDILTSARESFEIAVVENTISGIGEVTFDESIKRKIEEARSSYDALPINLQEQVSNVSEIDAAEEKYADLEKAYHQGRINNVEQLISSIGEVTRESGEAIQKAREAYNDLDKEEQAQVSATVLTSTEERYQVLNIDTIEFGIPYETSDFEMVFNSISIKKNVSCDGYVYAAGDGETLVVIDAKIKNLGTDTAINFFMTPFSVNVLYNDQYKYDGGYFCSETEIRPLSSKRQCRYIPIPEDIQNEEGSLIVYFKIAGNDYQYVLKITTSFSF